MFDSLGSDIVVMQELKIQRKDLRDDMVLIDGWDCYFSLPKHRKGYSGVGIYTRNATCAPIKAEEGLLGVLPSPSGVPYCELPDEESIGGYPSAFQVAELGVNPAVLDAEGRCLVLEFPAFVLLGIYSPANSNGLRDDFRYGFITALDCRIRNLTRSGKRVVLVGDLNVSRDELDTAGAVEDCRKEGLTHEDYISTPNRRIFNQLLIGGEVAGGRDEGREHGVLWDTTRGFHPNRKGMYTHWEQKKNARPGNFGGRIDFVLVAEGMQSWIKDANIQEGLLGSDHCPVFADFHDSVRLGDQEVPMIDIMNPPGAFENGERRIKWKVQDVPAFSAKKMPEFDRRRSIRSMFTAPNVKKSQSSDPALRETIDIHTKNDSAATNLRGDQDALISPDNNPHASELEAENSPLKRKVSSTPKEKHVKRQKAESGTLKSKGQQSLKGFFQTQGKTVNGASHAITSIDKNRTEDADTSPAIKNGDQDLLESSIAAVTTAATAEDRMALDTRPSSTANEPCEPGSLSPSTAASPSPSEIAAQLEATEQNQRSWSALFSKPVAPLCESHNEPCKTMQTKKKGSNQGRSFWMCARPLGPSGDKERGTQWRCPTFIWCSDWGGRKEGSQNV